MDPKTLTRFKKSLEARHRELRQGLEKSRKEALSSHVDHGKDEADRATSSMASEIEQRQKARDRILLNKVAAALKRLHAGSFGECLNCGQEINRKRLEAIPWVSYCIACQELIDNANLLGYPR